MRRTSHPAGTIHRLTLDSKAIAGNRLGDPTTRIIDVYVPAGQSGKLYGAVTAQVPQA